MSQLDSKGIQRPGTDDHLLWDIVEGTLGCQTVRVTHDLELFPVTPRVPIQSSQTIYREWLGSEL